MKRHPSNCMCTTCKPARRRRNAATRRAIRDLKESGMWLKQNQVVGPEGARDRVGGQEAAILNAVMIDARRRRAR